MLGEKTTILPEGGHFGTYTVERLLGRGGMGEVYLMCGPAGERHAVKVLRPDASEKGSGELERFVREAEFLMTVRHPNIVEVYDAGIDPETGLCFLTMEFMPGGSLRQLLESGVAMSFSGITMIAADIARALALVESRGLVHRDVKPDNIMFSADGTAKLADLGITRFGRGIERMTMVGATVGTPAYMSPEQMLDSHSVDIRSDLYSLGVVMYEMITGRRPNDGENAMCTLANAIGGRQFADVRTIRPDTPPELAALVSLLTHPSADERPASAHAVLEFLCTPGRMAGYADAAANPPRPPWYRDRGVLYAAAAMVLAVESLIVALATVWTRSP